MPPPPRARARAGGDQEDEAQVLLVGRVHEPAGGALPPRTPAVALPFFSQGSSGMCGSRGHAATERGRAPTLSLQQPWAALRGASSLRQQQDCRQPAVWQQQPDSSRAAGSQPVAACSRCAHTCRCDCAGQEPAQAQPPPRGQAQGGHPRERRGAWTATGRAGCRSRGHSSKQRAVEEQRGTRLLQQLSTPTSGVRFK